MGNKQEIIVLIKPTIKQLNRIDRRYNNFKIFCFHEYLIKYTSKNNNNIESFILDSILPPKYELELFENSKIIIQKLANNSDIIRLFQINCFNLFHFSRFQLLDKVIFPILKRSLCIENIVNKYGDFKLLYVNNEYYSAASLNTKKVVKYNENHLFETIQKFQYLILPYLAVIYKLIMLPLKTRLQYKNVPKKLNNKNILIGNINEFIHFKDELCNKIFKNNSKFIILHSMRRFTLYKNMVRLFNERYTFLGIDIYFKFTDIPKILSRYFHFLTYIKKIDFKKDKLRNCSKCEKDVFLQEMKQFYIYFYLVALKYYYITLRLMKYTNVRNKIVFSFAHTFYINTINNILKKNGYTTYTYNHGLIQSPNQMLSETSINYSLSFFDLHLMEKYGNDEKYIHIYKDNININMNNAFQNSANILILSKLFYPNAPYNTTIDFLDRSLDCIDFSKIKYSLLDIKPHPKEPIKNLKTYVKTVAQNIKILTGNLELALIHYNLVITPLSTAILGCLEAGIPFLIYKSIYDNPDTFIYEIPEVLKFENKYEFSEKINYLLNIDNNELNRIYQGIFNNYYYGRKLNKNGKIKNGMCSNNDL